MYINPVLLPQFTNREDLVLTIQLSDDDLNQGINLAGITGSGTFNNWTVTDGTIITNSTTQFTIPQYPIGNQLSAVALTVGVGLGILATDPIVIADQSGQNTMMGYVKSYAPVTGALVCQIGNTFQFEIRREQHSGESGGGGFGGGFTSFPGEIGTFQDFGPELTASLGNGILITDVGFITINIPESEMRTLRHARTRRASMTMTDSVNTRQLFIAQLPILSGGVTN